MTVVALGGCQSVAEQALDGEIVVDQGARGSPRVTSVGIYRLQALKRGKIVAKRFCSISLNSAGIKVLSKELNKSSKTLMDKKAADGFKFSVNPITKKKRFQNINVRAGVTFKGIPSSRRVVEKYSVNRYLLSTEEDGETVDSDYIMRSVGPKCRASINNSSLFNSSGKPVFVYSIAKGDFIYSKFDGLPGLTLEWLDKSGKKTFGDIAFSNENGLIYDRAYNRVFGYAYFPIGQHSARKIPIRR